MKAASLAAAFACSVLATAATAGSLRTEAGDLRIELTSAPAAAVTHTKTTYTLRLVDSAGQPITAARVTLTGRMADGMSAATPLRPAGAPGVYRGEILFTMEGSWDLSIRVVRSGGRVDIPLREDVARGR